MAKSPVPPSESTSNPRAAGDLDPGFGINGITPIKDPQPLRFIYVIAPDPTTGIGQKIYVACASNEHSWLARLLEDGTIDEGFGVKGYTLIPENPHMYSLLQTKNIIFLKSEKIIVFGYVHTSSQGQHLYLPAATCITKEGFVDTSFGDGGFIIYHLPLPALVNPAEIAISSEGDVKQALWRNRDDAGQQTAFSSPNTTRLEDGNLLLLGNVQDGALDPIASYLFKITPDGALDESFGTKGSVLIKDGATPSSPLIYCTHYDIDRQGGIVVAGVTGRAGQELTTGIVARYDAQGQPDQIFGKSGVVHIYNPSGRGSQMRGLIALDDGKVIALAAFFTEQQIGQYPAVFKLMPTGASDQSFNNGEPATIDLSSLSYTALGMTIDDGGRILIAGRATEYRDSGEMVSVACASRLMPNGLLDNAFGSDGTAIYEGMGSLIIGGVYSGVKLLGSITNDNQAQLIRLMG